MKSSSRLILSAALALSSAFAHADAIDPTSGLNSSFSWSHGLGEAEQSFDISVAANSLINVSVYDCCVPGDEFQIKLDGNALTFDTAGYVDGLFQGTANQVFLGAGSHTFRIFLTALAPGYTSGGASISFSATSPAPAVPEPSSAVLALVGLGLVGVIAKRRA